VFDVLDIGDLWYVMESLVIQNTYVQTFMILLKKIKFSTRKLKEKKQGNLSRANFHKTFVLAWYNPKNPFTPLIDESKITQRQSMLILSEV
jgi:hypothetical protein